MVAVTATNITGTSVRLNFTAVVGGALALEVQLAPRRDFKWCVCPIFSVVVAAFYDATGINQGQTYYGRAREVLAGGPAGWGPVFAFHTPVIFAQVTNPDSVMIEPSIIMVPEPLMGIVGSGTVQGFPSSNLVRDAPVGWKSIGGPVTLTVELAGQPWDGIAILNSNMPEGTLVAFGGGATAAAAVAAPALLGDFVPFRASANLPGRYGYHGWFQLPAPVSHKFVHITLAGPLPPAETVYIEHLLIGRTRRSKNHAVEKSENSIDMGNLERSRVGIPDRLTGHKMRRVEFDLALLTESEYETLYGDLGRRVGETEPIFVVPNSKRNFAFHDRMLYGNFSGGRVVNPASPYYTRSFTVDSII